MHSKDLQNVRISGEASTSPLAALGVSRTDIVLFSGQILFSPPLVLVLEDPGEEKDQVVESRQV